VNVKSSGRDALLWLRELGPPVEMWAEAERGLAADRRLTVNSHVHIPPNFSPFETTTELVDYAADQGLGVLGAGNYYDFSVYRHFAEETRRRGIFPLFGIEIIVHLDELARAGVLVNDPGVPGKMYVCGKGITRFDPLDDRAAGLIDVIRRYDSERIAKLVDLVAEVFECNGVHVRLTPETVAEMVAARHGCDRSTVYLQERHVVRAFQEELFRLVPADERACRLQSIIGTAFDADPEDAAAVQNVLRSNLLKSGQPAFVESSTIGFRQGFQLILALGGIPCYPVLADGTDPITPFETSIESLVENITARNIHCVEFIPVRNELDVFSRYVKTLRASGMVTQHTGCDSDGADVRGRHIAAGKAGRDFVGRCMCCCRSSVPGSAQ